MGAQAARVRRLVRHRAHGAGDARVRMDDHRRRARAADPVPARARGRPRGPHRRAGQRRRGGSLLPRVRGARSPDDLHDRGGDRGIHVPRHGRIQVAALLLRLQCVRALVRADRDGRRPRSGRPHDRRRRRVHAVPLPVRRDSRSGDRMAVDLHRDPRRTRVRHPADGLRGFDRRRQGPVRTGSALRLHADVPLLRHVLSARVPAALAAVDRLDLAAVARHRDRADG